MFEARQIVAAARRYGRMVQHGTQGRSIAVCREAVHRLREGAIGDLYLARALCFKRRAGIGRATEEAPPRGVDYDLWLGPARVRPFTRNRFHYNWHWQWEYGSGEIGNQAPHQLDIARWGLGVGLPTKITAMGMHTLFDDDQETPNVLNAVFQFTTPSGPKMLVADIRGWITNHEAGIGESALRHAFPNTIGVVFYGCRGYLAVDGYDFGYKVWLGSDAEPTSSKGEVGAFGMLTKTVRARLGGSRPEEVSGPHFANFIDAVRSRNAATLHADIEEGATSAMLVHLANISYRLGRSLDFDPVRMTCKDPEAQAMFTKPYRPGWVVPDLCSSAT
jgi:predicted dehydrogenase